MILDNCTVVLDPRHRPLVFRPRCVAGVRPWPSLRDHAVGVPGHPGTGRCRVRPRPSLCVACVDLPATAVCGVAGFGPAPRCAWLAADKTIGGFRKAWPGSGPGPRCAWSTAHTLSVIPKRCRGSSQPSLHVLSLRQVGHPSQGVAGVPPRPWLRAGMGPGDRRPSSRRCRVRPGPSCAFGPKIVAAPGSYGSVAEFTRPSLRGRLPPGRLLRLRLGVAGFRPRPSLRAADHRVRGLPAPRRYLGSLRPSLRVVRDAASLRPSVVPLPRSAPALVERTSPPWPPPCARQALPGSAPVLVARAWPSSSTARGSFGVAGFAPALVAGAKLVRPDHIAVGCCRFGSGLRCAGGVVGY